jgi:hypothetical protein
VASSEDSEMTVQMTSRGGSLSSSQVQELETALRGTLPQDYKEFLSKYNVASPEKNVYEIGSLSTRVAVFFGVSDEKNHDLLWQNQRVYANRLPKGVLGVASAAGGNLICLRLDNGWTYFWDHELEAADDEEPDYGNMTRLAPSFSEFLDHLEPYRSDDSEPKPKVLSVKLKPGFAEKFKKRE